MRLLPVILFGAVVTGGATPPPQNLPFVEKSGESGNLPGAAKTRVVRTVYYLRGCRGTSTHGLLRDAHAFYRLSRASSSGDVLETMPLSEFPPASYAPLPASAELAAELAAQKQITAELRAIKARMAGVEELAKAQYGALVSQMADAIKLRNELGKERDHAREVEANAEDAAAPASPALSNADPVDNGW